MELYRQSADQLSAYEARLTTILTEQMRHKFHTAPSLSEIRSWERSLPALRSDLIDAGLGGVEVLIEYQMPLTSKRADVVLAGIHPKTGENSYLVVELKQWSEASLFEDSEDLVSLAAYSRPVTHPVLQVRGYCDYLADFNPVAGGADDHLAGVAYLHNATRQGVHDLMRMPGDERGRIYTGEERGAFIEFLKTRFSAARGARAADDLLAARIAPSRRLLDLAAAEVQAREQFVLLDEQQDAYRFVLHAVEQARQANRKTAVIISGGPGSGKSVIALSLMGTLARQGRTVMHATGSRSFTTTLRKIAAHRNPRVRNLFAYFNSFTTAQPNEIDCLILDEAHRVRETSVNRWTPKAQRSGRSQLDELLSAARVPVFLLDQNQVVRPGEMGTVELIRGAAEDQGLEVVEIDLLAQFRSGGSLAYVEWVHSLLGLSETEAEVWAPDGLFDLTVADTTADLEARLDAEQAHGCTARIAAGYCWPWSDPRPDGSLVADVQIGDWARPWNLKGDRSVGGAPAAALWASDPAGSGQVGCVYTAQGFEYDYAGVILGPDLVRRGDAWVSVRSANKDPDFRNPKKVSDADFDRLVRHVYKVLMTRGLRGAVLYSTDAETQAFLKKCVGQV